MSQAEYYRGVECASRALRTGTRVDPATDAALVHAAMQPLLSATDAAPQRACDRGCAHCCHFPVGVSFGEAHRLAATIAADPDLRMRFLTAAQAVTAHSWPQLVGLPCPLLVDGACTAYDSRPLPCRAMASSDANACAAALHQGPPPPVDEQAFWRGLGAAETLAAASDPPGTRELRAAVEALLTTTADRARTAFLAARSGES